jgi:hypothetical protein
VDLETDEEGKLVDSKYAHSVKVGYRKAVADVETLLREIEASYRRPRARSAPVDSVAEGELAVTKTLAPYCATLAHATKRQQS